MAWLSLKDLAELSGESPRNLQYIRAQEPGVLVHRMKGTLVEYKTPDCVQNLKKRAVEKAISKMGPQDADESKARLLAAQAEQEELKLAKMRGEMITVAEASLMFQRWLELVRARLIAFPGRLAAQMVGLATAAIAMAKLEDGIRDLLRATQREAEQMDDVEDDSAEVA